MLGKACERFLEQANPQLLQLVEASVRQDAILVHVHLDVANGNLVGFLWIE